MCTEQLTKMKVYKILPVSFGCNSYILTSDGRRAVVVDCAGAEVYKKCKSLKLQPVAVLLTHGHYDHVLGCKAFADDGVPVFCGRGESDFIFSNANIALFGEIPDFKIFRELSDGDKIELGGINFKVIATPGHTAGSVCYMTEDCIFTGDTLFLETVGRTDLPTGSFESLKSSLKKLAEIKGNYKIYCGHYEDTTLNGERKNNAYLKC